LSERLRGLGVSVVDIDASQAPDLAKEGRFGG
jgi:hypothetical protein